MVINFNPLLQEKKPSLKKIDLGETECSCCLPECIIDVIEPQNLESQKSIRWCQRIQTSQEQRMNDQIGMYSVKECHVMRDCTGFYTSLCERKSASQSIFSICLKSRFYLGSRHNAAQWLKSALSSRILLETKRR